MACETIAVPFTITRPSGPNVITVGAFHVPLLIYTGPVIILGRLSLVAGEGVLVVEDTVVVEEVKVDELVERREQVMMMMMMMMITMIGIKE